MAILTGWKPVSIQPSYICKMWSFRRKMVLVVFLLLICFFSFQMVNAQCSVCTRTAQQLGEKPARGLNAGIIYLALLPLALIGFIGYRWWRREKDIS